jgi:hypothetical protein
VKKDSFSWWNKNKKIAALLMVAASVYPAGYAMDTDSPQDSVHAQITREALGGAIAPENLKLIIDANDSQDAPGSEGATEKRRHFDGRSIASAYQYVEREKTKALNLAAEADSEPEARLESLRHLGLALHSLQDFYLRSNYVETQLENPATKEDPYNIGLVDWSKVTEGKYTAAKHGDAEDALNKDSVTTGGGKTAVSGTATYHSVARDLAVRETQRQWNLFETLVRGRCGDRAPAVLAALRQASSPTAAQSAATKDRESSQTIVGDPDAKASTKDRSPDVDPAKMDDRSPDNPDVDQGP